ncbi:DTW domain-containing protein 2-like isoform X2 [Varroa jacobsoni]|uniref:tRNA-uridine aminocarboxypropyltransferase n=1 Tax=Varroa destructor TaxID=109461 RepID=A0A7M7KUJ4_VARDE|nr:DTW domain-containing protein 2-like isoform X1 [Varroa destructor]XP_022705618.1 DTW domain-containing protein 2-like isoform X2 [Varroa jacobsoni]
MDVASLTFSGSIVEQAKVKMDDSVASSILVKPAASTKNECMSFNGRPVNDEHDITDAFSGLGLIEPGECISHTKRDVCSRCKRPIQVCWCCHLPAKKISTSTRTIILQHPNEIKRNVRTAPMLEAALSNCLVLRGRHFSRHSLMREIYANESRTFVLYPSPDAMDIENLPREQAFNLIVIDGTWNQARSLYFANKELHSLTKVKISPMHASYYVVRTQPHAACLSTVESVALALSKLECQPQLEKTLIKPLVAMCGYQIDYGAQKRDSKEEQILSGTFKRKIPKKIENRIEQCKDFRGLLMR